MFVITLGFSENRDRAGKLMDGHKMWLSAEIIEITPSLTDARLEFLIQES